MVPVAPLLRIKFCVQVSCTVTFDPKTEGSQIPAALEHFQYDLKGVSFLPRVETGAYAQMPYEAITEDRFRTEVW